MSVRFPTRRIPFLVALSRFGVALLLLGSAASAAAQEPAGSERVSSPRPARDAATVHLDGPRGTTLYRETTSDAEVACVAPCDVALPVGETYRVGGVRRKLDAAPGARVVWTLNPPSLAGQVTGGTLIALGLVALAGGASLWLGNGLVSGDAAGNAASADAYRAEQNGRLAIAGGGAAATLLGALVFVAAFGSGGLHRGDRLS